MAEESKFITVDMIDPEALPELMDNLVIGTLTYPSEKTIKEIEDLDAELEEDEYVLMKGGL